MTFKNVLSLFLLLLITGCSQPVVDNKVKKCVPDWLHNPSQGGVEGAVGSAPKHFDGLEYQRNSAISNALAQLGMSDATISTETKVDKEGTENETKTTVKTFTVVKSNGVNVKAHIKKTWHDLDDDRFYVWIVKD